MDESKILSSGNGLNGIGYWVRCQELKIEESAEQDQTARMCRLIMH